MKYAIILFLCTHSFFGNIVAMNLFWRFSLETSPTRTLPPLMSERTNQLELQKKLESGPEVQSEAEFDMCEIDDEVARQAQQPSAPEQADKEQVVEDVALQDRFGQMSSIFDSVHPRFAHAPEDYQTETLPLPYQQSPHLYLTDKASSPISLGRADRSLSPMQERLVHRGSSPMIFERVDCGSSPILLESTSPVCSIPSQMPSPDGASPIFSPLDSELTHYIHVADRASSPCDLSNYVDTQEDCLSQKSERFAAGVRPCIVPLPETPLRSEGSSKSSGFSESSAQSRHYGNEKETQTDDLPQAWIAARNLPAGVFIGQLTMSPVRASESSPNQMSFDHDLLLRYPESECKQRAKRYCVFATLFKNCLRRTKGKEKA